MERFKLWDKTSNVTVMGGEVLTPDAVYQMFPHISKTSGVMLEYVGDLVGGVDSLEILKQVFEVDAQSDEESFAAIVEKKLNPPEPKPDEESRNRADIDFIALMMEVEL